MNFSCDACNHARVAGVAATPRRLLQAGAGMVRSSFIIHHIFSGTGTGTGQSCDE
jgi:hypothetical protein